MKANLAVIGALLLILTSAALAHHAYTAEFDTTKPIKLSGVLTKVEWSNPHIWLYLDVKENWSPSVSQPNQNTWRIYWRR